MYTLYMTTKFIGVKEFRAGIATIAKKAREENVRYVVMNRNKPLFEIKPFAEDEYLDSFVESMLEAYSDVKADRIVSHNELMEKFKNE